MKIEVYTKDSFDKETQNVEKLFKSFSGFNTRMKYTKIYDIILDEKKNYFKKIAKEVIIDPIVEEYRIYEEKLPFSNFDIFVEVWYKKSVTDVVGKSVVDAIEKAGFKRPEDVRTAKCFYFKNLNNKLIKEFINENFSNELINDVIFKKF